MMGLITIQGNHGVVETTGCTGSATTVGGRQGEDLQANPELSLTALGPPPVQGELAVLHARLCQGLHAELYETGWWWISVRLTRQCAVKFAIQITVAR